MGVCVEHGLPGPCAVCATAEAEARSGPAPAVVPTWRERYGLTAHERLTSRPFQPERKSPLAREVSPFKDAA